MAVKPTIAKRSAIKIQSFVAERPESKKTFSEEGRTTTKNELSKIHVTVKIRKINFK